MPKFIDLTGKKFGRLTVIERAPNYRNGKTVWLCHCKCGIEKPFLGEHLRSDHTKSCGCIHRKHGMKGTAVYEAWRSILQRCLNPRHKHYRDYGGRGITVCDRWLHSFPNFLVDMGEKPGPEFSIDRIDNDGPYAPWNCRWATIAEQQNNRRDNVLITFQGLTLNIAQWARKIGLRRGNLWVRLKKWSVERALTESLNVRNPHKK